MDKIAKVNPKPITKNEFLKVLKKVSKKLPSNNKLPSKNLKK